MITATKHHRTSDSGAVEINDISKGQAKSYDSDGSGTDEKGLCVVFGSLDGRLNVVPLFSKNFPVHSPTMGTVT